MVPTPASGQTFKVWLRNTQAQFLFCIHGSQKELKGPYGAFGGFATSVCIEVDHIFYYYQSSNRGKDTLFSALKEIYTKNGAVDVFYECHKIMAEATAYTSFWQSAPVVHYGSGGPVAHNVPEVDGHQVVCFKRDSIDDRKRNIAHDHILKMDTMIPGNGIKDDVCNFLNDLSDDLEDDRSMEDEVAGFKHGKVTPLHDQESLPEKSDS